MRSLEFFDRTFDTSIDFLQVEHNKNSSKRLQVLISIDYDTSTWKRLKFKWSISVISILWIDGIWAKSEQNLSKVLYLPQEHEPTVLLQPENIISIDFLTSGEFKMSQQWVSHDLKSPGCIFPMILKQFSVLYSPLDSESWAFPAYSNALANVQWPTGTHYTKPVDYCELLFFSVRKPDH